MQCRKIERVQSLILFNFLALKHLLLLLGITQQSTSRWIWRCQKDRIVTIQQLTLVLGRRTRKGGGPSLTHRPDPTANFIRLRASAAVGPESREADGCPSFLEKRDRTSARRFSPQGHRVRALCPNKKRKDCVCHRVSNNEDTDPHTILNAMLVLAMIEKKTVLLPECTLQTKQSVKTKKRMMYSPGVPYIAVAPVVTS